MLNVRNINQYYGGSHILRDVSTKGRFWRKGRWSRCSRTNV
jgi:hypothetical protein